MDHAIYLIYFVQRLPLKLFSWNAFCFSFLLFRHLGTNSLLAKVVERVRWSRTKSLLKKEQTNWHLSKHFFKKSFFWCSTNKLISVKTFLQISFYHAQGKQRKDVFGNPINQLVFKHFKQWIRPSQQMNNRVSLFCFTYYV